MQKNLLVVEDDDRLRTIIKDFFIEEGYDVFEAADGRSALEVFNQNAINLVILDIMIPELDGWSVCKRIRNQSEVPLILLTARSEEDDKLMGYELGADDYITKPFSLKVLVAKAKMLIKRAEGSIGRRDGLLTLCGIEVDRLGRVVRVDQTPVNLAPKEYDVLLCLMENRNVVLSRESILEKVWGYDYFGDLRTVDTHVRRLRTKLGEHSKPIVTVIGSGYKFEVTK